MIRGLTPFQNLIRHLMQKLEHDNQGKDDQEIHAAVCLLRQLLIHSIAGSVDIFHLMSHDSTDFIMGLNKRLRSKEVPDKIEDLITEEYLEDEGVGDLAAMLKRVGIHIRKGGRPLE